MRQDLLLLRSGLLGCCWSPFSAAAVVAFGGKHRPRRPGPALFRAGSVPRTPAKTGPECAHSPVAPAPTAIRPADWPVPRAADNPAPTPAPAANCQPANSTTRSSGLAAPHRPTPRGSSPTDPWPGHARSLPASATGTRGRTTPTPTRPAPSTTTAGHTWAAPWPRMSFCGFRIDQWFCGQSVPGIGRRRRSRLAATLYHLGGQRVPPGAPGSPIWMYHAPSKPFVL